VQAVYLRHPVPSDSLYVLHCADFSTMRIAAALLLWFVQSNGQLLFAGGLRRKALLELYTADRTTRIGPVVDNMVIDLAKTPSLNVKVSITGVLQRLGVSSVSFLWDNTILRTDNTAPYWMLEDSNRAWTPAIGNHTIAAKAYRRDNGNGRKVVEMTINVIVIDRRTQSPMVAAAPIMASAPAPPIASPVAVLAPMAAPEPVVPVMIPAMSPTVTPALAPALVPALVPALTPALAPVAAPVAAPMALQLVPLAAPARAPTMAPKAPSRAPSKAPTKAPVVACDASTVAFINCITQSDRTLTLNGTTAEDQALQWLVQNDTLALAPNSDTNRVRLRQRFALLTLGFQNTSSGQSVIQSVPWNLSARHECDWYNDVYFGFACEYGQVTSVQANAIQGTVPADLSLLMAAKVVILTGRSMVGTLPSQLGWWTSLTHFSIYFSSIQGTIPSSIGAWTALVYLDVSSNKLTGSLPSAVSAWTALNNAFLDDNNLNGTMPTFGGSFCPSKGNGSILWADCKNTTGRPKIVCKCCNQCY
jgi:hypothetical protein